MRLESSSIAPSVRDALAVIHQQALELIVRGASPDAVLEALCDGIDALDPDLISSVLLADPDGERLWPKAGRRVPDDYKQIISPLPIASAKDACGTVGTRVADAPLRPAGMPTDQQILKTQHATAS